MKRLFILFFALMLTVSLCACGETNTNDADATAAPADTAAFSETFNKATAYIKSNVDMSDMSLSTQDENSSDSLSNYWISSGGKATFPVEIEISGNTIEIGKTTVKDVEGFGLDVSKGSDKVNPNETIAVELSDNGKTCVLMTSNNLNEEAVDTEELTIGSVSASFDEFALPFKYSGLSEKSTLSDVIAQIGQPNNTINLTVDASGAVIMLSYSKKVDDAERTVFDNLAIYLNYDPGSDSAVVKSVQLNRNVT